MKKIVAVVLIICMLPLWVEAETLFGKDDFTDRVKRSVISWITTDNDDIYLDLAEFVDVFSLESDTTIINLYLRFDHNNSLERTRRLCYMMANDFAVLLNRTYDVDRITVFWETPYFCKEGYGAKYIFETMNYGAGKQVFLKQSLGPLNGRN